MGTIFECTCNECGTEYTLQDNGGFRYTQWLCNGCGVRVSLPRFAHRPLREGHDFPPMLRRKNYVPMPPIPDNEIKRFSVEELVQLIADRSHWPAVGDRWDEYEITQLLRIVDPCSCGVTWTNTAQRPNQSAYDVDTPHPHSRCPSCHSKDFIYRRSDILTD